MKGHEHAESEDERSPMRKLLDEPRYVVGKRRSDRTAALLFVMVMGGGGWHEVRTRGLEAQASTHSAEVSSVTKELHDLSERITKLESIAPTEAAHLQDTLKRIESRLDKIDSKIDTKADRRRSW